MASNCNKREILQTLTSVLARNDATKLCPMLSAEEPRQRRGQKPIEDLTVNKFCLPVAWRTSNAQKDAGNCSCHYRRVEFPQDVEKSDYFNGESGLDYLPLDRFESMLNDEPIVAPYNAATNTVCTCPKIPLALLPPQQKSSVGSCRCVVLSKVKEPEKVSTGTDMVNIRGSGSASRQKPSVYEVATQSEPPPKPVNVQRPPVDTSKCKKSEDGKCPCCKRKSKRNKKEKPDDTKSNLYNYNKLNRKKSTISSKNTQKKRAAAKSESSGRQADTEGSTTSSAPPSVKRASIKKGKSFRKKENNVPGRFVAESKSSLSTGAKLNIDMVKGMYPGTKVGHKTCCSPLICVPKTMGWLWNLSEGAGIIKPGPGWKPGAIQEDVYNIILRNKKLSTSSDKYIAKNQEEHFKRSTRFGKGNFLMREEMEQPPHNPDGKPTLHLHKSGGRYNVIMHPPAKRDDILFSFDKNAFDSCTPTCDQTSTVTNDSLQFDLITPYSIYKNIPPTKKACVKIQKTSFSNEDEEE